MTILGKPINYHDQTNDGSFKLLEAYEAKSKAIDCFWNACAFGLEASGWLDPDDPQWKKIQFPDYALMVQYNTKHLPLLKDLYSWVDPNKAKLNEFFKYGVTIANKVIFNHPVMLYSENASWVNFDIIVDHIIKKSPVVTSSHLYGGHFICHHAYDNINDLIGYSDSYNGKYLNWIDRQGFYDIIKKPINGITKDYCKMWFSKKGA